MNKKMLISLFAGLLLAGGFGTACAQEIECAPVSVEDEKCQGNKHDPEVRIDTDKKEVHPEFICASHDSVIEFKVIPPGKTAVGAVAVKAKDPLNTWLIGTNYPRKKRIDVIVPEWVTDRSVHHYYIFFEDGNCIDPRVHVEE